MAYSVWWTEHDDGKFALIDADGYLSIECCCRPCLAEPDNSDCPCYGEGSVDAPLLLEIVTDCGACSADDTNWICWSSSSGVDPLTCVWEGGFEEPLGAGECRFNLTMYRASGYDDYWTFTIYSDNATVPCTGVSYVGTYEGSWDCASDLVFVDASTSGCHDCYGASVTVSPFVWEVPS